MEQKESKVIQILVVDDEMQIRDILQRGLTQAGYECLTAAEAEEALRILASLSVDLVITDISMPGMSGIELMAIVKEKYASDVIVMTGFPEDLSYEEVIGKGASDFIQKPIGIMEMILRVKRVLRERALIATQFYIAEQLRSSVENLKRAMEQTVNALATAMEKRDPYTVGHQQRVAKLACAIAQEIGFSQEDVEGIRIEGLLHDIGKISIPTDILNKPGRISQYEYMLIQEHPQSGYEILKDIRFEQPIVEVILQHHERVNGSGYPQGLKGRNIMIEAKIMAVADVVEAMASHRPYRPSLGIDKALEEIANNRGVLYEVKIVDACLKLFRSRDFSFSDQ
jgi:putative two-component system response regulator